MAIGIAAAAVATVAAAGTAFAASTTPPTQVYKWTDDQGVVHYGDSLPPQYSQRESTRLNDQGVVIGHVAGAKDAAQLAEQARIDAAARQRKQHDQFLLATYTSARDISQLRDERVGQIDAQITAATTYIQSLDARLASLQAQAQQFKPYSNKPNARRMPDRLAEDLVRTSNERQLQSAALATKRNEQSTMRAQFESDIARYTELTSHQRNN